MNMDSYNYKKTIDKASEQIRDIDEIKELCYLRKENPEATYAELAKLLTNRIKVVVSKSNINHLFIKIKEMAKGYRHED